MCGFTALPAGYRDYNGTYRGLKEEAYWWTSAPYNGTNGWCFHTSTFYAIGSEYNNRKELGYNVRCIKED